MKLLTNEQFDVLRSLEYRLGIDEEYFSIHIRSDEIPKELDESDYYYENFIIATYNGRCVDIIGKTKDLFDHFNIIDFDDYELFSDCFNDVEQHYTDMKYIKEKLNV